MQPRHYISSVTRKKPSYAAVTSTLALVFSLAALCVGGAVAAKTFITSKDIKNNSITSADLRKAGIKTSDIGANAVRSADIQSGAVQSADIGEGEVTPGDVTMPAPTQCKVEGTFELAAPSLAFQKVTDLCAFTKGDATSLIEANWTGSVLGENGGETSGCVFQLRIDGQPAPAGAGEVFKKGIDSVSSSALWMGLSTGPHTVEVWAKITVDNAASNKCVVGPPLADIGQTMTVAEQVI